MLMSNGLIMLSSTASPTKFYSDLLIKKEAYENLRQKGYPQLKSRLRLPVISELGEKLSGVTILEKPAISTHKE